MSKRINPPYLGVGMVQALVRAVTALRSSNFGSPAYFCLGGSALVAAKAASPAYAPLSIMD